MNRAQFDICNRVQLESDGAQLVDVYQVIKPFFRELDLHAKETPIGKFFKWAIPASFSSFQTIIAIFTANMSVYPVFGVGIQTHDLQDMSLLPYALDQGSLRPIGNLKWSKIMFR